MSEPSRAMQITAPARPNETAAPARPPRRALNLALAILEATRPRQWPKNLLVFAAPLAGASLGRGGFGHAALAAVAFTAASSAVYLLNDVADAERDRRHP